MLFSIILRICVRYNFNVEVDNEMKKKQDDKYGKELNDDDK